MAKKKVKKNSKKLKKTNGSVGGKADVHTHEDGKRNKSLLGHNAIFTPEVIDDIHIKAQLGRYRMRGMALPGPFRITNDKKKLYHIYSKQIL